MIFVLYQAESLCAFASCRVLMCLTFCWFCSDPTAGGRRTSAEWSGSPAVWTTPALMQMTLWRRLSRVRTFLTAATMKAGLSLNLNLALAPHLCVTMVTSPLDSFWSFRQQLETVCQQRWDHCPQRDTARQQVRCLTPAALIHCVL